MIIAIDPGKNGAIAVLAEDQVTVLSMPKTEHETIELFRLIDEQSKECSTVYIEKVHAMPNQGVTSMFTFGQGYGFLRGVIQALRFRLEEVSPQKWQKSLGLIKKSKDEIFQYIAQRYPKMKVYKKQADALGILEYAIKLNRSQNQTKDDQS